jgi:hypothetical protein
MEMVKMEIEKFNILAEQEIENQYLKEGYMGTESKNIHLKLHDNDLDIFFSDNIEINAFNQSLNYEINGNDLYFQFSESGDIQEHLKKWKIINDNQKYKNIDNLLENINDFFEAKNWHKLGTSELRENITIEEFIEY